MKFRIMLWICRFRNEFPSICLTQLICSYVYIFDMRKVTNPECYTHTLPVCLLNLKIMTQIIHHWAHQVEIKLNEPGELWRTSFLYRILFWTTLLNISNYNMVIFYHCSKEPKFFIFKWWREDIHGIHCWFFSHLAYHLSKAFQKHVTAIKINWGHQF